MTNLLYLGIPAAVLILVGIVISIRERRPRPITSDVDSFSRSMKALSSSRSARPGDSSRGTHAE